MNCLQPSPLFRKLEEDEILKMKEKFAGDQKEQEQCDKVKQTSKTVLTLDSDASELEDKVVKQVLNLLWFDGKLQMKI